jgi:hypothetical protein
MQPRVTLRNGREVSPAITVLLVEREPDATADLLRHIGRKSHDPQRRYAEAIRVLSSSFYQYPENFSGDMTALFWEGSAVANALAAARFCVLHFEEGSKAIQVPSQVEVLEEHDPAYQVTYWHNFSFNPVLPPSVRILAFRPDWTSADGAAEPPAILNGR